MVVCRYYQQGNCRFGQSCRFEHSQTSKYTYNASTQQASAIPGQATSEQLFQQVSSDLQSALKGKQWLLSCYSPFKGKPLFPGFTDYSSEEIRLLMYDAKLNNTLDQTISHVTQLAQKSMQQFQQLTEPNLQMLNVLESIYRGESPPNPFESATNPIVNTNSVFGLQHLSSSQSIFCNAETNTFSNQNVFSNSANNTNSVFGSQADFGSQQQNANFGQTIPTQSIFGGSRVAEVARPPSGLFAAASQQFFGTSTGGFGGSAHNTGSPFNGFALNTANVPHNTQANIFSNNVFGQSVSNEFSSPFFPADQTSTSICSQKNTNVNDELIYSKEELCSSEDLTAFKNNTFTLGFIPEKPPPQSLCT